MTATRLRSWMEFFVERFPDAEQLPAEKLQGIIEGFYLVLQRDPMKHVSFVRHHHLDDSGVETFRGSVQEGSIADVEELLQNHWLCHTTLSRMRRHHPRRAPRIPAHSVELPQKRKISGGRRLRKMWRTVLFILLLLGCLVLL